jgi:ATP adenylyltransferase
MVKKHQFRTAHAVEAYKASRPLWDTPLYESESFVALPTVGALLEGWLLVVPKSPLLAFANLPDERIGELESFLGEVTAEVARHYGSVAVFEHGAPSARSPIGCGVDYAHLHLVPTDCDLLEGAQKIEPSVRWSRIKSLRRLREIAASGEGYWLLQQQYGCGDICVGRSELSQPSQLFRRILAAHIGVPDKYDWKRHCGEEVIAATLSKLASDAVAV